MLKAGEKRLGVVTRICGQRGWYIGLMFLTVLVLVHLGCPR